MATPLRIRHGVRPALLVICVLIVTNVAPSRGDDSAGRIQLDAATRSKCLAVLRGGFDSDEFWPSIHAAEGLTLAGYGQEVLRKLPSRLARETDAQHRCGLARELVRAGDRSYVSILLDILGTKGNNAHTHACESLYKVNEIGDGRLLRQAMDRPADLRTAIMAAAALGRWGSPLAYALLRREVQEADAERARLAAWVLARIGDERDLPALQAGCRRFKDPQPQVYFQHALAALGDPTGKAALLRNLSADDATVRTHAAMFASDARLGDAKPQLVTLLDDPSVDTQVRAAHSLLALARPEPPDARHAVVRDVFRANAQHPRYSEGSIVALRDGALLFGTTEFSHSASDFAAARIVGRVSRDEGRTWDTQRTLQENVGRQNTMSLTLRRLDLAPSQPCPLAMFYLVKNSMSELNVFVRISNDETGAFEAPIRVTSEPGYHVMNNDRVTRLASGRLVVPVATTSDVQRQNHFVATCYLSDDQGRHWRKSATNVDYAQRGAMEPEVLELEDHRLLMILRTQLGHIAASYSRDEGDTWGPAKSWGVRSPEAPATLRRVPSTGDLLLVWNDTYTPGAGHGGRRTPLTAAISRDEGRTWINKRQLETDEKHSYAYTSVMFFHGRVLLSYYVRDASSSRISTRFRSLPISWFYDTPAS